MECERTIAFGMRDDGFWVENDRFWNVGRTIAFECRENDRFFGVWEGRSLVGGVEERSLLG